MGEEAYISQERGEREGWWKREEESEIVSGFIERELIITSK